MTPKHRQRYAAFFVPLLAVFALTAVIPATVQAHPETAGHHDDPAHPHDQSDSKGGSNLGNEATNPEATMNSPVPVNGNSAPPSLTSTRKPEACSGGLMVYQNWGVASTRSDAADVNNANIQPIFTCHFDKGWYVGLPDLPQTYNNETNAWTAQIGGVVGRCLPLEEAAPADFRRCVLQLQGR